MSDRSTADPASALEHLRGPAADPGGFYGTVRHRLPLFAAVGALSVLAGLIPFPTDRAGEVLIAGGMFLALTVAAMVLPWRRLPRWSWPVIPVGYIGVVALIRDAQGGGTSGLVALYFLPVVWLAFYGKRSHVVVGLVAVVAALVVPMELVGAPAYPATEWRISVITTAVTALVSFYVLAMVTRDRRYVADMAEQALLVQRGARQAKEASEQLVAQRERLLAVEREVTQVLVEQNHQLRELTQMKDDVVATVSHELRTPLTSIRGFVELLLDGDGTPLDEEQAHMLRAIDRNSLQLLRVADDLLADPGRGRGLWLQFVDTDLSALAREAVGAMAMAAADRGIGMSAVIKEPVMVHGDPLRLHQLFGNLLANAVKFTPTGGRVAVRVTSFGQLARLDVLDDGPGIPAIERAQLFDRFYRLASSTDQGIPGTGLGLAIAKSVVEAHNGTIEVVDTAGWSTTFRVHLPAAGRQGATRRGLPLPNGTTPDRKSVGSEQ